MIQIDKGIPLPAVDAGAKFKYPWNEMAVGDSFFIPGKKPTGVGSALYARKKKGEWYTMRTATENGADGVRIWRIEPKVVQP